MGKDSGKVMKKVTFGRWNKKLYMKIVISCILGIINSRLLENELWYILELMEKDKWQESTDYDIISLVNQDVYENDEDAGTGLGQDRIENE